MIAIAHLLIFLVSTNFACATYDEAFTDDGLPRPAYARFEERHGGDVLNPSRAVTEYMLGRPLGDAQKAWPVPLILGDEEYALIREGVAQRASVYREFFYDIVMGDRRIFDHLGVEFQIFTEEIFRQHGVHLDFLRSMFQGRPRSLVRFMYGPDLIRTAEGWRVLEDNVGSAPGGLGDVDSLREGYANVVGIAPHPASLIGDILTAYHDYDGPIGLGMDVAAIVERNRASLEGKDAESDRIAKILAASRVAVTRVHDANEITDRMLLNRRQTILLEDSRQLESFNYRAYLRAIESNRIDPFITPGTDALSNKAFLPWIDVLAGFYLKETLTLRSPTTVNLFNIRDVIEARRKLGKDLVVKSTRGRAGDGVWFLKNFDRDRYQALLHTVREQTYVSTVRHAFPLPFYVAQAYQTSSVLPMSSAPGAVRAHVDIRPITYVGPTHIVTPTYPFARAFTPFGNGLHNMHQGAVQVLVLTPCELPLVRARRRHDVP